MSKLTMKRTCKNNRYGPNIFHGILIDTRAAGHSTAGISQCKAFESLFGPHKLDKSHTIDVKFGIGNAPSIGSFTILTIGYCTFHVIDANTSFLLSLLDLDNNKAYFDNLNDEAHRLCWIDTYLGPPAIINHDAGTNLASADFQKYNKSLGIFERYHMPLRRAYEVIREDLSSENSTTLQKRSLVLQMATKAVNDTAGADGIVPTLLFFGAFSRIVKGDTPTSDIMQRAKSPTYTPTPENVPKNSPIPGQSVGIQRPQRQRQLSARFRNETLNLSVFMNTNIAPSFTASRQTELDGLLSRGVFEFVNSIDIPAGTLLKVLWPLYGIPEEGKHWFKTYRDHHKSNLNLKQDYSDACLPFNDSAIFALQTDDTLFACNDEFKQKEEDAIKSAKFQAKNVERLMPGCSLIFNGAKITLSNNSSLLLVSQESHCKNLSTASNKNEYIAGRARGAYIATVCM
ncbi:hypothetical protein EPUL_004337 [Erysiphe pulchra]|uniref:Integrase catalytic domain-containing protein n=1 Tax=Erysiphe pulchra TaxID=225359 RepID=A0A2S4PTW4_9PEZI|nr:hypothetical protein EPUL_004337 [Erysiphe pulchra]